MFHDLIKLALLRLVYLAYYSMLPTRVCFCHDLSSIVSGSPPNDILRNVHVGILLIVDVCFKHYVWMLTESSSLCTSFS